MYGLLEVGAELRKLESAVDAMLAHQDHGNKTLVQSRFSCYSNRNSELERRTRTMNVTAYEKQIGSIKAKLLKSLILM